MNIYTKKSMSSIGSSDYDMPTTKELFTPPHVEGSTPH